MLPSPGMTTCPYPLHGADTATLVMLGASHAAGNSRICGPLLPAAAKNEMSFSSAIVLQSWALSASSSWNPRLRLTTFALFSAAHLMAAMTAERIGAVLPSLVRVTLAIRNSKSDFFSFFGLDERLRHRGDDRVDSAVAVAVGDSLAAEIPSCDDQPPQLRMVKQDARIDHGRIEWRSSPEAMQRSARPPRQSKRPARDGD